MYKSITIVPYFSIYIYISFVRNLFFQVGKVERPSLFVWSSLTSPCLQSSSEKRKKCLVLVSLLVLSVCLSPFPASLSEWTSVHSSDCSFLFLPSVFQVEVGRGDCGGGNGRRRCQQCSTVWSFREILPPPLRHFPDSVFEGEEQERVCHAGGGTLEEHAGLCVQRGPPKPQGD